MMFEKPSRAERKKTERSELLKLQRREVDAKGGVRKRDRYCRFPLCGCRALGLTLKARPEVAHDKHKGMGGNPSGDRSTVDSMVLLCLHRHQHGAVSLHKGTLRAKFLTPAKFNGPIAWEVEAAAVWGASIPRDVWIEVGREVSPQVWEIARPDQRELLDYLAEMNR